MITKRDYCNIAEAQGESQSHNLWQGLLTFCISQKIEEFTHSADMK